MKLLKIIILHMVLLNARASNSPYTHTYGPPALPRYGPYVPAVPGHTPRCARPGQTFCELADDYPRYLIRELLDQYSGVLRFLRDEKPIDFHFKFEDYQGYDYEPPKNSQLQPASQSGVVYNQQSNDTTQEGYKYTPPFSIPENHFMPQVGQKYLPVAFENPSLNQALPETRPIRSHGTDNFLRIVAGNSRKKRLVDSVALCEVESRFVAPQTAINTEGDWKFVVNIASTSERYSQLTKIETCSSEKCSGLCDVQVGYTSQCKQQYVQKRLVALHETGDRFYNDIFWFPHGCTCHISQQEF